jgi:hypothetical protein
MLTIDTTIFCLSASIRRQNKFNFAWLLCNLALAIEPYDISIDLKASLIQVGDERLSASMKNAITVLLSEW